MRNLNKYILLILTILPLFFVYRAFFTNNPLVWGDAPFFYPENLKELFSKPLAWDFRNDNFGAPQNLVLWLFLPTFLLGLLNYFFAFNSEILIRLIFYFPSVILAFAGAYFFIKKYVKNGAISIFGSILYSLNTYFLTLVDGGQIGVALAYGIFPLVLVTFKNLSSKFSIKNFIWSTVGFGIITNIDLRIAVLSLFSASVIYFFEAFIARNFKVIFLKLIHLLPVVITVILLDAFWILPLLLSINSTVIYQPANEKSLITVYDGLFLFSPHFPKNEFGQVASVPYYFVLVPLLIFGNLVIRKTKEGFLLSLALLVFIFLVKGESWPFGQIYSFIISHIPLGFSFRDSTKFFIPLLLLSSTLLSMTVNSIFIKLERKKILLTFFYLFVYVYILFLIWPAILGKLSGVLSGRPFDENYKIIYHFLQSDKPFFRTLWFPERPPFGFSMTGKEALSANILYKEIPFATMIEGEYDLFYFLHDPMLTDWFKLLGIKYVFFPEDERKKTYSDQEIENRKLFLEFVDGIANFKILNWNIDFPGYMVSNPLPKIFGQEKVIIVSGDTSIYTFLKSNIEGFNLSKQGFLFLEDGILEVDNLLNLPNASGILVFNHRDREDLKMSFLQKNYLEKDLIRKSHWGYYGPNDYLTGKYQLLKNSIDTKDLLYGRGFHFSTIKNEKIHYTFNIKDRDKYYIAFRTISASESAGIKIKTGIEEKIVNNKKFKWDRLGPFELQKGDYTIEIENLGGFNSVNILAVFSEMEGSSAQLNAAKIQDKFGKLDINKKDELDNLGKQLSQFQLMELTYSQKNTTEYSVVVSKKPLWIVFSDHFNPNWKLNDENSYPFYSMINGFHVNPGRQKEITLRFRSQIIVDLGLKVSIVALVVFIMLILANLRRMR